MIGCPMLRFSENSEKKLFFKAIFSSASEREDSQYQKIYAKSSLNCTDKIKGNLPPSIGPIRLLQGLGDCIGLCFLTASVRSANSMILKQWGQCLYVIISVSVMSCCLAKSMQ